MLNLGEVYIFIYRYHLFLSLENSTQTRKSYSEIVAVVKSLGLPSLSFFHSNDLKHLVLLILWLKYDSYAKVNH